MVYHGIGRNLAARVLGSMFNEHATMQRVCAVACFSEGSIQARAPPQISLERHMREGVDDLNRNIVVLNEANNDGMGVAMYPAGMMKCHDIESADVAAKLVLSARGR